MDLQIGNFVIAGVSMLSAAGATIVAWIALNRGSRKQAADAAKETADTLHRLDLAITELVGRHNTLERAHTLSEADDARVWNELQTAQGEQFSILREIQGKMSDLAASMASSTATVLAMKERLDRRDLREIHAGTQQP